MQIVHSQTCLAAAIKSASEKDVDKFLIRIYMSETGGDLSHRTFLARERKNLQKKYQLIANHSKTRSCQIHWVAIIRICMALYSGNQGDQSHRTFLAREMVKRIY